MPMNTVQVGGVRYDQETPLDKILKGLQIAETAFKIPISYETYNKAAAEADLAKNQAAIGGQEAQEKLSYAKGAPLGPLSKLAMGVIENRSAAPVADAGAPNSGSSQVGGPDVTTASPLLKMVQDSTDTGKSSALGSLVGAQQGSPLAQLAQSQSRPATESASAAPFSNLVQPGDSVSPKLGGEILDYQKKIEDLRKSKADAGLAEGNLGNQPTEIANTNAKPQVEAAEKFNAAVQPLAEQWRLGDQANTLLSSPRGLVANQAKSAIAKMSDAINRVNPEAAKDFNQQLGGSQKLADVIAGKITGNIDEGTRADLATLVNVYQAGIQDQYNRVTNTMAQQYAGTLRMSPEDVKNQVFSAGSVLRPGASSQKIAQTNQAEKLGIGPQGNSKLGSAPAGGAPHPQVRQNGHLYNWNTQTKRYE